jgi:hypothetical protein
LPAMRLFVGGIIAACSSEMTTKNVT